MGSRYSAIRDSDKAFMEKQHLFFVATATDTSSINVSPKGKDTLCVLSPNRVVWLNLTGSGNETSAHLQHDDRITIMYCAFDEKPLILRLYGRAKIVHTYDEQWDELVGLFDQYPTARQIVDCEITLVQRSCGFGVPFMEYKGVRPNMETWAKRHGPDELRQYWEEKNQQSIDGIPTHIMDDI